MKPTVLSILACLALVLSACGPSGQPSSGGGGGSLVAGLFLQEFANGAPWAHLDIAGTARASSDDGYVTRGGTGWGVRTLVELARRFGATDTLLASEGDVVAKVAELTQGGVEYSFECIGIAATVAHLPPA